MKFAKVYFNKTALHISAANENIDIVKLLLQNKRINVRVVDEIFFLFFNKISTFFILMICLDFFWKTPAGVTKNQEIINLIKSINVNEQQ